MKINTFLSITFLCWVIGLCLLALKGCSPTSNEQRKAMDLCTEHGGASSVAKIIGDLRINCADGTYIIISLPPTYH